jgi:aryl-alcohol dehydrogenase-like predicted oxidoreductase
VSAAKAIDVAGREVPRIGLGTNRLQDAPANRGFVEGAVAAGVRMIDTAHLYASGGSERTIGAALAPFDAELLVATKGGYNGAHPDRLRAELEESLERLRTDSIQLYYLHRVDPEVALPRSLEVLAEYREAGTIRHVGVSEVSVDELVLARSLVPIAAVQNEFSLDQRKHDEVLDYCTEEGIPFVPFFPLRGGGRTVDGIAARIGATRQQVKLAWLLRRSEMMLPIPGTLSLEHLEQNLAALDVELSDEDFAALNS